MQRGNMETKIPYKNPANISPKIIAGMDAGVETRRSRVLPKVSQGAMMGVDEEEIKNSVIPSKPGNRLWGGISLPNTKAKNKQVGKKKPNMSTGGFI
jgi:hypothetical protein